MNTVKNERGYRIVCQALAHRTYIPISESEYHEIAIAKLGLVESLYLEEKFDVVLENFYEYETELLQLSTHYMLFGGLNYSKFQNEINLINRRVINLLSACKLYIDHSCHHLSNIFKDDDSKKNEIKSNISHEYDTTLGYRTMEALRNYVQHRGFPVQRCVYNSKRVDGDKIQFSIEPYLEVEKLGEDGKFKKTVLNELEMIGKRHELQPLLRSYISSIGSIHEKNRALLKNLIVQWENTFNSSIEAYKSKAGSDEPTIGLAAVFTDENGCYTLPVSIFMDIIEHRNDLESKNGNLQSLASRYVTSEAD